MSNTDSPRAQGDSPIPMRDADAMLAAILQCVNGYVSLGEEYTYSTGSEPIGIRGGVTISKRGDLCDVRDDIERIIKGQQPRIPGKPSAVTPPPRDGSPQDSPYTIWALDCPLNKRGVPVMGNFGGRWRRVVVIESETWTRLIAEVPGMATAQFRVGSYDDE